MAVCDLAARCSQCLRWRSQIPESRKVLAASSSYSCHHSPVLRTGTWQKGAVDLGSVLSLQGARILTQHCELDQRTQHYHRAGSNLSCRWIRLIMQVLPLIRHLREKFQPCLSAGQRTFPDDAACSLRTHSTLQRCCRDVWHRNEQIQFSPWFERSSIFHPRQTKRVPLQI